MPDSEPIAVTDPGPARSGPRSVDWAPTPAARRLARQSATATTQRSSREDMRVPPSTAGSAARSSRYPCSSEPAFGVERTFQTLPEKYHLFQTVEPRRISPPSRDARQALRHDGRACSVRVSWRTAPKRSRQLHWRASPRRNRRHCLPPTETSVSPNESVKTTRYESVTVGRFRTPRSRTWRIVR